VKIYEHKNCRELAGLVSVYLAVACFMIGLVLTLVLFGAMKNPTLDSFFTRFATSIGRLWISVVCISVVTLVLSCFGRDGKRALGLAVSIANILVFGSILGAGA